MEVLHVRCASLDVHKDSVVAAVRLAENGAVHLPPAAPGFATSPARSGTRPARRPGRLLEHSRNVTIAPGRNLDRAHHPPSTPSV